MANDLSHRAIAEALGTFSLVVVGCGARSNRTIGQYPSSIGIGDLAHGVLDVCDHGCGHRYQS